jgi:antirestriction protein
MFKIIISLILIISFFTTGFCFAFDAESIKNPINNLWQFCAQKTVEYWNHTLAWINNDMKPWIGKHLGENPRKEFEREFNEVIQEISDTIRSFWNKAKELIN